MFAEKSKKVIPELPQRTRQESTHSDIRHPASQIGNQAMLELLRSDRPVAAGVPSLIDEMREKYGWNRRNISTSAGVPLPSDLKKEYEESSGVSLDDVKVHYNSDQPERFGAEAFAYGENIFLKPAQESLITHELGHVVQQKQGLVNATHNENSYPVNEDGTLEKQADKPVNHAGKVSRVKVRKVAKPVMQFEKKVTSTNVSKKSQRSSKKPHKSHDETITKIKADIEEKTKNSKKFIVGVSVNGGKVGSIYFGGTLIDGKTNVTEKNVKGAEPGGRLRLIHNHGPRLVWHERVLRKNIRTDKGTQLYEYYTYEGSGGNVKPNHKSRGMFEEIESNNTLKDIDFNRDVCLRLLKIVEIAQASATKDVERANVYLRDEMKKDEILKKIPLNLEALKSHDNCKKRKDTQ